MEIQDHNISLNQERNVEYESFFRASSRQSQKLNEANEIYISSFEKKPPDLEIGVEIPTVDAVGWQSGLRGVDIRPRVVDKSTGEARLLDSGAMISTVAKKPGDKIHKLSWTYITK